MGNGKYAPSKPILRPDGKPISAEYAQSPCLADWDGDGDYDMAIGFIGGPVKLFTNNGDLTFTENGSFGVNGTPIDAGDGGPCMVEWNGDGKLDLLLGNSQGEVVFYPGTKLGSRALGNRQVLIPALAGTQTFAPRKPDSKSPVGFSPGVPGARTKPFAADWNGDGKLDLLVGDYMLLEKPKRVLTAKEKTELATLETRMRAINNKMMARRQKHLEEAYRKVGKKSGGSMNSEESKAFSDAYRVIQMKDKEYLQLNKELGKVYPRIRELTPTAESTGFVWVYLRK